VPRKREGGKDECRAASPHRRIAGKKAKGTFKGRNEKKGEEHRLPQSERPTYRGKIGKSPKRESRKRSPHPPCRKNPWPRSKKGGKAEAVVHAGGKEVGLLGGLNAKKRFGSGRKKKEVSSL